MLSGNLLILFTAILPVLILMIYIYRRDLYKKEPVGQIVKAFFYGVLSVCVSLCFSSVIEWTGLNQFTSSILPQQVETAFWGAAIPEESAKLFMLWLFLRKNKFFDEHVDGIVYAVAVSMGFAAVENILYLFSNQESWFQVGLMRACLSVPGHYAFAVFMGYYYSLAMFGRGNIRTRSLVLMWVIPVIFHGIFNSLLFLVDAFTILSTLLMIGVFVFCYYMHGMARKRIVEHLQRDRGADEMNL